MKVSIKDLESLVEAHDSLAQKHSSIANELYELRNYARVRLDEKSEYIGYKQFTILESTLSQIRDYSNNMLTAFHAPFFNTDVWVHIKGDSSVIQDLSDNQ